MSGTESSSRPLILYAALLCALLLIAAALIFKLSPVTISSTPNQNRSSADRNRIEREVRVPIETGKASWYDLDGKTAGGEPMKDEALTAAHPSLPLGTKLHVENLSNGRSVDVRVNDRGPFVKDRIIDLSKAAAERIEMMADGVAIVELKKLGPAQPDQ